MGLEVKLQGKVYQVLITLLENQEKSLPVRNFASAFGLPIRM